MLRHSARLLRSRALCAQRNAFSTTSALQKAEIFKMPAMSPTMEKGGVTSWKVKEGEAFSSGDVLLEVETDKAQIDVEAQDDGILAKIILNDGAKDVDVGTPIAILADPGDDLATLEIPDLSASASTSASASSSAKTTEAPTSTPTPTPTPTPKTSSPTPSGSTEAASTKANPSQTFFPSVHSLLEENGISREDAISKISATGPQGRLLKGDVLAYLGKISKDSPSTISSFINSHSKLDLSNIEKVAITPKAKESTSKATDAAPADAASAASAASKDAKPAKKAPEPITRSFSLEGVLALKDGAPELGLKSFSIREYVEGASQRAERYAYQQHAKKSDYYDAAFEEIISPPKNIEKFSVKLDIPSLSTPSLLKKTDPLDFVDELFASSGSSSSSSSSNEVKVTVTLNAKASDAQEKANVYLDKLEKYLKVQ